MTGSRRNDFLIPTLAVLFDSAAIAVAFLFSYWLRFHTSLFAVLPLADDTPPLDAYIRGLIVVVPVWLLLFRARQMYGARRNVALPDEFFNIIKIVTLGMLLVMSAAFFYRAFSYSRLVFGLLWVNSIVMLFFGRVLLRAWERSLYRRGRDLRNAVIIGAGATADRIYRTLHNHPLLGYRIIGYFADTRGNAEAFLSEAQYLGSIAQVQEGLVTKQIELALIALDHEEHQKLFQLISECEGVNVEFMMVPDILELMATPDSMGIREIEGIPFIKIKGVPMTTWGRIMKRAFDLTVSAILLVFLSPLMLLIALLIKVSSNGTVLFRQDRIGLDGGRFMMLKFRTMVSGADKYDEAAGLGIPDDPRQTTVGRTLRSLSLDELPQLLNVLMGEMSLVGPRPERPFFVEQFKSLVPKYLDRHRLKTGMTGWAQVNGLRGNSSIEERIRYDLYYIENWSIGFDLKILMKTFGALLFHPDGQVERPPNSVNTSQP